ncbi:MAG: GGDEF domain-containing protein [Pleomorphochaeta sp.]
MRKTTEVFLRAKRERREVAITDSSMPLISKELIDKWQRIINIMAKIINVPAGLIMQITEKEMVVFLKSQNADNPYEEGDNGLLGSGLYCETVIGEDNELLIDNALDSEIWKDNSDVKLNMVSYYGVPIHWPNKEFFGTICVLDNKKNTFTLEYKTLLKEFRSAIEVDLKNLVNERKLRYLAEMDVLTSSYNRNKTQEFLIKNFNSAKATGAKFAIAIMDINRLKEINDNYGHVFGDKIIKTFAQGFNLHKREEDIFGRWGGDEFVLICPNYDLKDINLMIENLYNKITGKMEFIVPNSSFCYGCAEFSATENNYQKLLTRADDNLYNCKEKNKIYRFPRN